VKKRLKQFNGINKDHLKKGSNLLLKVLIPELDLDWDGVYYILKDRKNYILYKLKKQNRDIPS